MNGRYQVGSGRIVAVTHDTPFIENNVSNKGESVNSQFFETTNTIQFRTWFKNSVVKNEDGTPMVVYHGTSAKFSEFKRGDIGIHVGTESQARIRNEDEGGSIIMPLYASIINPLRAAFDFGDWHGKNVAGMLIETEQFDGFDNQSEIEDRLSEIDSMDDGVDADDALRK